MKVCLLFDTLSSMHTSILRENTGNAETFAVKLGISRATLLKSTFYYENRENVEINITIKEIKHSEAKNINGGAKYPDLSMDLDKLALSLH